MLQLIIAEQSSWMLTLATLEGFWKLDKHVKEFRSLVSHFRTLQVQFFLPYFLSLLLLSDPGFGLFVCLFSLTYCYTLSCQRPCLPGKSGVWLPCLFHIHFCLCHYTFFPIKTQLFFLKRPDLSICPSFPLLLLQDLMFVWSLLFLHLPLSQWY